MWHGLMRDWQRWSLTERVLAILMVTAILLLQVPLIF
jgi:cell division protein FtsL